MRKALESGGSSSSTIVTTETHLLTVVCTPVPPEQNLTKISKHGLSVILENTASSLIEEACLHSLRNIITVDAANYEAVEALFKVTVICGVPRVPRSSRT